MTSVLIARGSFGDIYEPAWCRALRETGVRAEIFDCHARTSAGVLGRVERRILFGPGVSRLRRELLAYVRKTRPQVTLLYQGHYFDAKTVSRLSSLTTVVGYHNDDPFGDRRTMLRYRLFLGALRHYRGFHVYRAANVQEALSYGVPSVRVLKPYYIPWLDYPRDVEARWRADVVYVGHAEPDFRGQCIDAATQVSNRVSLYGDEKYWKPLLASRTYERLRPLAPVYGESYRAALCGAKIALCFFSKWNRDQYTRRAFEIPACGTFLLSERTPAMAELFVEGVHADYFSSPEECSEKIRFYLAHESARQRIAAAGRARVIAAGHDIFSRMRQWAADVSGWVT
jgi:spore maturation protein CgeB